MKEVDCTELQIDIMDCTAFTVTRGIQLFIAFWKQPKLILTKIQ